MPPGKGGGERRGRRAAVRDGFREGTGKNRGGKVPGGPEQQTARPISSRRRTSARGRSLLRDGAASSPRCQVRRWDFRGRLPTWCSSPLIFHFCCPAGEAERQQEGVRLPPSSTQHQGGAASEHPLKIGCQKATVTLPPRACSGESGCLQPSCSGWSPPSTSRPFKGHLAGMSSGRIYESCCSQVGKQRKKKRGEAAPP